MRGVLARVTLYPVTFGYSMKYVKTPIIFRIAILVESDAVILFILRDDWAYLKIIMHEILWQIQ